MVYYQVLDDYITWFTPFTNVGDFKGGGLEADYRGRLTRRITLWGNASYTDTTFDQYAAEGADRKSSITAVNDDNELTRSGALQFALDESGIKMLNFKSVENDLEDIFLEVEGGGAHERLTLGPNGLGRKSE